MSAKLKRQNTTFATKVSVSFTNSTLNETIWATVSELVWPRPPFGKAGGPVVNCKIVSVWNEDVMP